MTPTDAAAPVIQHAEAPSLRRRAACGTYELLILFGLSLVPGAVGAGLLAATGETHAHAVRWGTFILFGAYFIASWHLRGQTLPMQTWRIRVETLRGRRPGWRRSLARYMMAYVWIAPASLVAWLAQWTGWQHLLAIAVGGALYLLLTLLHPAKQFWHDAACGTRLVRVD